MKEALSKNNSFIERGRNFLRTYEEYVKINSSDSGWNGFYIKLRKKFINKLTLRQKREYSLDRKSLRNSYYKLKNNIKNRRNKYPTELFYETSLSVVNKILNRGDSFLEIGFGDYPILVDILDKEGMLAFGIEPFPRIFDKSKTFKGTLKHIPKEIEKNKFDVILANMVYSASYVSYFSDNFKWETKNKHKLLSRIWGLLKRNGYFILIDDIGTIFNEKELRKYFKINIFEKDTEVINFDKGRLQDFERITILRKKSKVS